MATSTRVFPLIEALPGLAGTGWTIVHTGPGKAAVDPVKKVMYVPLDGDEYSHCTRMHEFGHAHFSEGDPGEWAETYGVHQDILQAVEDSRIHQLLGARGVMLDPGVLRPEEVEALDVANPFLSALHLISSYGTGNWDRVAERVREAGHPQAIRFARGVATSLSDGGLTFESSLESARHVQEAFRRPPPDLTSPDAGEGEEQSQESPSAACRGCSGGGRPGEGSDTEGEDSDSGEEGEDSAGSPEERGELREESDLWETPSPGRPRSGASSPGRPGSPSSWSAGAAGGIGRGSPGMGTPSSPVPGVGVGGVTPDASLVWKYRDPRARKGHSLAWGGFKPEGVLDPVRAPYEGHPLRRGEGPRPKPVSIPRLGGHGEFLNIEPHRNMDLDSLLDAMLEGQQEGGVPPGLSRELPRELDPEMVRMGQKNLETAAGLYERGQLDDLFAPWGPMVVEEPVRPLKASKGKMSRKWRSSEEGVYARYPHRFFTDGHIFGNKRRVPGGTVIIDASGSMSLSPAQIHEMVEHAPGCTVACYAGDGVSGVLRVLAKKGRRVEDGLIKSPSCGSNIVDLPALMWGAELEHPRVWISDGYVTGVGDRHAPLNVLQCLAVVKKRRFIRARNTEEAVDLLKKLSKRYSRSYSTV